MRSLRAPLVAAVMLLVAVAGCLQGPAPTEEDEEPLRKASGLVRVEDRHLLPYDMDYRNSFVTTQRHSVVLERGPYEVLPAQSVFVEAQVPLGKGLPTQQVHLGLFLPEVPDGVQVPVIADVGPYFGEPVLGDVHATEPARRLGAFLIDNFVRHGYAVAQVSVLGTGDSGGCMDLMGLVEQAGVQAAVDWLGIQPWSNGAVALIGRSYDGSTPWEAAVVPSEHLKTIVPISGLLGMHDLMWRNGSAETRAAGVLWGLYYAFTYTGNEGRPEMQVQQIAENALCPDTQTGGAQAVAAYVTGDMVAPAANAYWVDRSFQSRVLEHYEGSVYYIHGMQDWNVDPHMAFPFYQQLEAKGVEVKGLFGQWGHHYPDRPNEHAHLRWDWAQDLLEWFDYYLKGTGPKPPLHVEMQDDRGQWRIEETWPPKDARAVELRLGSDFTKQHTGDDLVLPTSFVMAGQQLVFRSEPLNETTRILGLPQFHVRVTPTGPGGQLYAELRDADTNRRLGHAIMDLRFAAGGIEAQPVVPGQAIVARMEFFPFDSVVEAGHRLELRIANTGRDYLPSSVSQPVMVHATDESVLRLFTVERGPEALFLPPGFGPDLDDGQP